MPKRILKPLTQAPSRLANSLANKIDPPTGEGGFMRGLLAGGIQGLGDLASESTSPMGLASMMVPGGVGARGMMRGAKGINKALEPTLDIVQPNIIKQVSPSANDVNSLIGDMQRNLAKIPSKKTGINPGQLPAEMIPRGAEAGFNAARANTPVAPKNVEDMIYEMIMNNQAAKRMR